MSYYTQSGNRRSDRIAGNPPETNLNPQHNSTAQNTFSPFNDTQAAADGVSYGSSTNHSSERNAYPTQDNIAFLQQPSQASTNNSRSSTPISLRGRQIQKNLTELASTNKNPPQSTNTNQRSNTYTEDFSLQGPPTINHNNGPASNIYFNGQQTNNANHHQHQQMYQPQPPNTMSTPYHQPNQAYSTPFQPINKHQQWQHNTPHPTNNQPNPPVVQQQPLPENVNFNFAQPQQLNSAVQQRFLQIESRLTSMEQEHQASQQRLMDQMAHNHNIMMKLLQQQIHHAQPPSSSTTHHQPPKAVTFANDDLLNLHPLQMNTTDQPSVHPTTSFQPTAPPATAPPPSAAPPPPPATSESTTPPIVDLTHDSEVASHITSESLSHPPSLPPSKPSPLPPVTPTSTHHSFTTTASQQPIIVKVEGKKDTRLNFKPFKSKKDDYEAWKAGCLSKIHTSGMYPTATTEAADGTLAFNESMDANESRLIVQQTLDSLDQPSHFTTGVNIQQIKAHALWGTLDAFYGLQSKKRSDDDDYSEYISEWANFTRNQGESLDDYTLRYRKLVQSIKDQPEIPLTITHYDEIKTYLREMQEPSISDNIVMNFRNNQKEWCTGKTIMDVQIQAQQYINFANRAIPRYKQQLLKTTSNSSNINNNSNGSSKTNPSKQQQDRGKNNNGDRPKGFDYDELEANLKKSNDVVAYLEKCYKSNSERFGTKNFKSACSKANCWEQWKKVADTHNVQYRETESRARRVYNNSTNELPKEWLDTVQNSIIDGLVTKLNSNSVRESISNDKKVQFEANLPKVSEGQTKVDSTDKGNNQVTNYLQKLTPPSAPVLESPSILHSSTISSPCSVIDSTTPSFQSLDSSVQEQDSTPTMSNNAIISDTTPTPSSQNASDCISIPSQSTTTTVPATRIVSRCKYNKSTHISINSPMNPNQKSQLKAIPDSGATDTMSGLADLFENITYFDSKNATSPQPTVTLGDDTTEHPILGYGWIRFNMQGKTIRQVGLYIPALGDITLISIRQHMQYKGCYFHAENNSATLAYPSFTIQLRTEPEIEADIDILTSSPVSYDYDESIAAACPSTNNRITLRLMSSSISPYLAPSTPNLPSSITKSVQIMKLMESATIPSRGTPGSIGYDVTAAYPTTINPGDIGKIGTGLSTSFNNDMYLRIAPRSSLALKHITVEGGVVDSDYRGEIKVLLKNNSPEPFHITTGQKIAQFIFESANTPLIEIAETLQSTQRGTGGFGSTDLSHHGTKTTTSTSNPSSPQPPKTTTKAHRSFLHDSFRIDPTTVILMNYSNPFRPIARRVKVPYHPSEAIKLMNPSTGNKISEEELIPTDNIPLEPTTTLKSYILSDKTTKTPSILEMDINPDNIITNSDSTPQQITLQYPDDEEQHVNPSNFPSAPEPSPEDMEEDAVSLIDENEMPTDPDDDLTKDSTAVEQDNLDSPEPEIEDLEKEITCLEDSIKDLSAGLIEPKASTTVPPRIRPVDKVNKSLPKILTMSEDALKQSIGFLNPTILQRNINKIGTQSVRIQRLPQNPSIDPGEVASLSSNRRSNQVPTPAKHYGDIWHMDIGYGPCTSIGGMKYTLLLIDKFSRYKFVYGLTNLTTSLHSAMKQFLVDCGTTPSLIRTDFDNKFLGGTVSELLQDNQISVEAAPPYRQHQNGMVERHWQTIVNMARNWLTSSCLPSSYWYFAVKRACEVTNLLPVKKGKTYTTPFQLVYKQKADYRNLIPMFCLAYIKQPRMDGQAKNSWVSKTLKCILVGKCNQSDSLLFYHPPSKQLLSCADGYRLDTFTPPGPHFNQTYAGDFIFNLKSDLEQPIHHPPAHEENSSAWIKLPDYDKHQQVKILSIPIDDDQEPYIVQHIETGDIHEALHFELKDHDPDADPTTFNSIDNMPFPHLPWITNDAKATLYLPNIMPKPKRGYLQFDDKNNEWSFIPGTTKKNDKINLPDFITVVDSLIANKKLFKGWVTANKVYTARRVQVTSNFISRLISNRKVSAKNLHDLTAPTLLKHHKLHPEDRAIWDEAYREEYQGLMDIDTWEIITEEKYNNMKGVLGNLLPTMAITTIKYDGKGNPDRAKYRIVALGNLDPHNWSKPDCFAPVLSQMELRFLTALAVRNRCIPKTGDVSQAFCQSYLPSDEHYVLRPPPGCPITPPNSYLKLKKTLYGLKRSPRHFYQLAVKSLKEIGMEQHPYSPCIFYGTLIEGEPPIYLGLYVDDFIYFSESPEVEKLFEKEFSSQMPMTFNPEIDYFLGINFTCKRHSDGHVSIKLDQESFVDTVVQDAGLSGDAITEPKTPYRSGLPIDSIPIEEYDNPTQEKLTHLLQVLVGNLNWLSISTRPDIAPATNMLAKYMAKASKGHIEQAKRVIKYLKGTKHKGILFTSKDRTKLTSFVKFPINPSKITALCDANWGPQDQSKPNPENPKELELFKSRSMSGYLLWFGGPLHWVSKRQSITARSSAEAEIYATDECTKQLIHLSYIIEGLDLIESIMKPPTTIYNDNNACVCWSKTTTTKGLRHIQMRENAIREAVSTDFISVKHIEGKINLSDMFTKEDKDTEHFIFIRDFVLSDSVDEYDTIEEKLASQNEAASKDNNDESTPSKEESEEQVSRENENTKEIVNSKDIIVELKNTEDSGKLSTIDSPPKTQSS